VSVPRALCAGIGLACLPCAAVAQIPDKFTNLQVLPKDISQLELIVQMRSFASALGVHCEHCHVGAEAADFKGADFASDEKEKKRTARAMQRMVRAINEEHISKLTPSTALRVECVTCHRGLASPRTLAAEVEETLEGEGIAAAIARYRELRASSYGRGGYDFGQGTLNALGEKLLRRKRPTDALALLDLNLEFFPDASWLRYLAGEAHRTLGHREQAIIEYEKAMALEPDNPMAKQRLQEMRAQASPSPSPGPND